jgi:hypothetical protein
MNYSALANAHILPVCYNFTNHCLVTDSNIVLFFRFRQLATISQILMAKVKVKVKVTLRLAVYCQSVRLHSKPLDATCFHSGFLLGLFFNPEDSDDKFLRNVG